MATAVMVVAAEAVVTIRVVPVVAAAQAVVVQARACAKAGNGGRDVTRRALQAWCA
ncbi:hypothetical protein PS3A_42890 [Pseudomonas sp. 3A(2025)]